MHRHLQGSKCTTQGLYLDLGPLSECLDQEARSRPVFSNPFFFTFVPLRLPMNDRASGVFSSPLPSRAHRQVCEFGSSRTIARSQLLSRWMCNSKPVSNLSDSKTKSVCLEAEVPGADAARLSKSGLEVRVDRRDVRRSFCTRHYEERRRTLLGTKGIATSKKLLGACFFAHAGGVGR